MLIGAISKELPHYPERIKQGLLLAKLENPPIAWETGEQMEPIHQIFQG